MVLFCCSSYQCQVSLNENFGGGFPSTMEKIVRENETVEFNKFLGDGLHSVRPDFRVG
jgi:hypothetical protein